MAYPVAQVKTGRKRAEAHVMLNMSGSQHPDGPLRSGGQRLGCRGDLILACW